MPKFIAKVSFSHDVNMYDPEKEYELENVELVAAWEKAGYVEVIQEVESFEESEPFEEVNEEVSEEATEEKPKVKKGKKEA